MEREKDPGSNVVASNPPLRGSLKPAVLRAAGCCLAVLAILNFLPRVYPTACAALLPAVVDAGPEAFGLRDVEVSSSEITMQASSTGLSGITLSGGQPAPGFDYTTTFGIQNIHIYPVIALGLLMGWPLSLRSRLVGLVVAVPLLILAGTLDAYAAMLWAGAGMTGRVWSQIGAQAVVTPENQLAFEVIKAGLARIGYVASFFSNGGRAFLACMVFAISLAPAIATPSRRNPGAASRPAGFPGRPEDEESARGQYE